MCLLQRRPIDRLRKLLGTPENAWIHGLQRQWMSDYSIEFFTVPPDFLSYGVIAVLGGSLFVHELDDRNEATYQIKIDRGGRYTWYDVFNDFYCHDKKSIAHFATTYCGVKVYKPPKGQTFATLYKNYSPSEPEAPVQIGGMQISVELTQLI